MTGLSVLTEVNRWAGVAIAVVGAVVVAPEGAGEIRKDVQGWFRRRGRQIRGQLARFLPFLRQDVNIQVKATGGALTAKVGLLAAAGRVWDPSAPVAEQIEALRDEITGIKGQLHDVASRLAQETSDREQSTAELEARLETETAELRRLLDDREYQSARIDARGLPVIAFGIILSGLPDRLAQIPSVVHIPFVFGWVFPIVGIALAVAVGVRARRAYRARPR